MRYRWDHDKDDFVDRHTGKPMPRPKGNGVTCPAIWSDVEYMCPVDRKMVTSRSQRREMMKRHNVREVDPSEHTPVYTSKKDGDAARADWEAPAKPVDDGTYKRLSRAELPEKLQRATGG